MRLNSSALDYWYWMLRGFALQKLKRYEETVAAYDKVTEGQPGSYRAWTYKGLALLALDREEEATASFLRALEANPTYDKAKEWLYSHLRMRAEVWRTVRDAYRAQQSRYEALGVSSTFSEKYERVSDPKTQEQLEQALVLQRKVVQVDPTSSNWLDYAALLDWAGRAEEALDACTEAIRIEPNSFNGWLCKANLLKQLERYEGAIDCFEKILEVSPLYMHAWEHRGDMYGELQRHEEAVTAYQEGALQIRRLVPKMIQQVSINQRKSVEKQAYLSIGRLLEKSHQHDEAITAYRSSRQIAPEEYIDSSSWLREANLLQELGRYEELSVLWSEWLKTVNSLEEKSAIWLCRGNMLEQREQYEEAIAALDQCIQINPNSASGWARRGDILRELQRFQEAVESYDKAIVLDSTAKYVAEKREQVLEQLG